MARQPVRITGLNTAGVGPADIPNTAAFDTYVGPAREVTVDAKRGILALHNGVTPGGVQFAPGGGGETITVASIADLKGIVPAAGMVRYLKQDGRFGFFFFNSTNQSAMVTADPAQAVFIPPSSGETGASGAWVRQFEGDVHAKWFGLAGAGTAASNTLAVNRAIRLADVLGVGVSLPGIEFDIDAGPGAGIIVKSNTRLYGEGYFKTIMNLRNGGSLSQIRNYQAGSGIRRDFALDGLAKAYVQNVIIEDLAIIMNHPAAAITTTDTQVAVDFRNITRSEVRNCWIGNYHPVTDTKGSTRPYLVQGYAVATGNESGGANYSGGECNTIRRNFIAGAYRAVIIDDNNLNPTSAAYSQRIIENDIQIAQILIYQASQYGAGNLIENNTLQSLQIRQGNTDTITCGIWLSGYGNVVNELYGEYGNATFILRLDGSSHSNRARYSGTCSATSGIITEGGHRGFRDAAGGTSRNIIEFFADTAGGSAFNSLGAPQRMISGGTTTQS